MTKEWKHEARLKGSLLQIRVTDALKKELVTRSSSKGVSISVLVRHVLFEYVAGNLVTKGKEKK